MRRITSVGLSLSLVLAASAAGAAGGKETSVKGFGGGEGGKGGPGAGQSGVSDERNIGIEQVDRDKVAEEAAAKKPYRWEAGAAWETHALFVQNDLQGGAPDEFFNYFSGHFRFDLLKHNRFEVRAGFYQRFIADPGESGLRGDDIVFSYARIIPLPQQFRVSLRASVIAPTSFISQKMGVVTAPRGGVQVDKGFGKYVNLSARTFGEGYIQTKTSMQGGAPNPIARLGFSFDASVAMPFHKPLSIGTALYTGYTWFYDANSTLPPLTGYPADAPIATQDPQFQHNPTQQSYGGELYVGYLLPALAGFKSDLHIALANGDPSLGYSSRLHDGVSHFYLAYRNTASVYGALSVRY